MKMQWIMRFVGIASLMVACSTLFAGPGPLVSVAATGGATDYRINVWLNGRGPLSGQQFHITSGLTLAITPVVPVGASRCYNMGIEILTPGYSVTSGAVGQIGNISLLPTTCTGQSTTVLINGGGGGSSSNCLGPGGACRVFITAATTTGAITAPGLTGIDAGNYLCNNDANTPGTGNYKAWLSSATINAVTNIAYNTSLTYYSIENASAIANSTNLLTSGTLLTPIGAGASASIWTGTTASGTAQGGGTCVNWTSDDGSNQGAAGDSSLSTGGWTSSLPDMCDSAYSLYCFEDPT